ncbi:cupin domain-containing protein [Polaribacter litorisediminis]|uniref:cupin domain-containing protein n=1 Tax=Polaribacter litorisediminis TaxID=1908341 RepID=UPI001CBCE1A3|nr:cupin domain-containing protein [Polaribacter litorisediminis]
MNKILYQKTKQKRHWIHNKYLLFYGLIGVLITACKPNNNLPDPLEAGWKEDKVCKVLVENEKVRTLKCVFPPRVGHDKHFHAKHFGYAIKGSRFRITDATGTREVNVPSGYNFYNEKIKWHKVLNIGDSTAIFLIVEPK